MIEAAKQKLKAGIIKFCIAFTIGTFIGIPATVAGLKAAGVKGNIEFPSVVIGGGTEQYTARAQQLAALEAAMPLNAITGTPTNYRQDAPGFPKVGLSDGPLPQHKPVR